MMRVRGRRSPRESYLRLRTYALAALVLTLAAPAWAEDSWAHYYLKARDEDIPAKRYDHALQKLEAAVRLKPRSELNARPYGMIFEDYFPFYYQAVCYFHRGDFNSVVRLLNIEESQGAIRKRSGLFREFLKLRTDAEREL